MISFNDHKSLRPQASTPKSSSEVDHLVFQGSLPLKTQSRIVLTSKVHNPSQTPIGVV